MSQRTIVLSEVEGEKVMPSEIRTKYKYIEFFEAKMARDQSTYWECYSRGEDGVSLGTVEIYEPWKQYCFFPAPDTLHSSVCLDDIADFLRQVNKIYAEEL